MRNSVMINEWCKRSTVLKTTMCVVSHSSLCKDTKWASSWENLLLWYANNKASDQPANLRSLIRAFVVRCLDSIIHLLAIAEISRPYLVSSAVEACLSLNWSQTPKTGGSWRGSNYTASHKSNHFKTYIINIIVAIYIPLFSTFLSNYPEKRRSQKQNKMHRAESSRGPLGYQFYILLLDWRRYWRKSVDI